MAIGKNKSRIRDAVAACQIMEYQDYRLYLSHIYAFLKSNSQSYSYIKFAVDLGFKPSNFLRLVLANDRKLGEKNAQIVAQSLGFAGTDRRYFLCLVDYNNARKLAERDKLFADLLAIKKEASASTLDERHIEYFSSWHHSVIREMIRIGIPDQSSEGIKKQLSFPLRSESVSQSLNKLTELGFIKFDKVSGRYLAADDMIATARQVDHLAVVKYHQEMLNMASEAITRVDEKFRQINALTLGISPEKYGELKLLLDQFVDQLMMFDCPPGEATEVVQVNLQMFPFTDLRSLKRGKDS
jgi:uncharacterized protein (TIGR02147 family)